MNHKVRTAAAAAAITVSSLVGSLEPAPLAGISIADKAEVSRLLLASGADIRAMNLVRQQLSTLKGGGLARLAAPARVRALVLSDVVGDDLSVIASGPTAPPIGTRAEARALIAQLGLGARIPGSVRAALDAPDTPALLKGLLFGPDGAAFSPTHTRKGGRLYRYYVSQTVLKHGAGSCPVGRVPAGEIEAAVIDQMRIVFRQPEIVAGTWKAAREKDVGINEAETHAALMRLDPLWDEMFPAEQARIVTLLVERVDIGTNGLNFRLRMDGLGGLAREMRAGDMGAAA